MEIVHVQVYSNYVCAHARGRGREQTCVCEKEKMVGMYFLYCTNDTNGDTTQTQTYFINRRLSRMLSRCLWRGRGRSPAGAAGAPRARRRRRRQSTMRPSCCS